MTTTIEHYLGHAITLVEHGSGWTWEFSSAFGHGNISTAISGSTTYESKSRAAASAIRCINEFPHVTYDPREGDIQESYRFAAHGYKVHVTSRIVAETKVFTWTATSSSGDLLVGEDRPHSWMEGARLAALQHCGTHMRSQSNGSE